MQQISFPRFAVRKYFYFPLGWDQLTLSRPGGGQQAPVLRVRRRRYCPCACAPSGPVELSLGSVLMGRESWGCANVTSSPFLWAGRQVLLVLASAGTGFLLHLVPAAILTPEVSLGSSQTHQQLGAVWMLLAVIYFVVCCMCLRPPVVRMGSSRGDDDQLEVAGDEQLYARLQALLHADQQKDGAGAGAPNAAADFKPSFAFSVWPLAIAWLINAALFINGVVVGFQIVECQKLGGCQY